MAAKKKMSKRELAGRYFDELNRVKGVGPVTSNKFMILQQVHPRWAVHLDGIPILVRECSVLIASRQAYGARLAARTFLRREGFELEVTDRIEVVPFLANGQIFRRVILVTKDEKDPEVLDELIDLEALKFEAEAAHVQARR